MIESSKLLKSNISDDLKYFYNKNGTTYPWKTSAGGEKEFLLTFLNIGVSFECIKPSIAIHSPYEFPNSHDFLGVEDKHEYEIKIVPIITKTDESLRQMSFETRKCYFNDEKELKFFKIYTKNNCEFECLSHALYQICKCVPFYYIRNSTWDICNFYKMKNCIDNLLHMQSTEGNNCNCLPACNSVSYMYEIIQNKFTDDFRKNFTNVWGKRSLRQVKNLTLRSYYKDTEYYALLRHQEFKLVDFLSYVGGILGLFAGISSLSIFEVIYFITLRLFTDLWRHFRS
ncbi:hypothetical protein PVAND_009170 [Polypedilum vanderplanki]|uniref:Uncharacterized protein n=1 Tax=Polypedilum vanderplanki TaxID=319348 RepID=A0A9J6CC31_POLVA|nr:hypothetical protein PVAND_009170 [Polypedilum vanderplanki]